jgi:phosphopantothenoylcysteine decarboxylase / phosphopantothenate---cysteine ligase
MMIPSNLLEGKKILLGVTGSISAYKSAEIIRLFIKAGAEVRVVMSDAATKFITPLTLEALSRNKVLNEQTESWSDDNNHIQITEWCDLFVIAPCSAHTLNKLANGLADNLLTQCALAYPNVKLLAPAANTHMIHNPITQASIKMLSVAGYEFVATQVKELACQSVGDGALAEPLDIFYKSAQLLLRDDFWQDRRVIVTGGGTIEKIDDVRYLSNFSSGTMASALACALYLRGADVNLISTRKASNLPRELHTIDVDNSAEMLEYLQDSIRVSKKGRLSKPSLMTTEQVHLIQKDPFLFMAAAISDYIPTYPQEGKIKKGDVGQNWELPLKKNVDILETIDKSGIKTIAFKAEMDADNAAKNARALIETKGVDAVCLNLLKDSKSFGTLDNAIEFITENESITFEKNDKLTLSLLLIDHLRTH